MGSECGTGRDAVSESPAEAASRRQSTVAEAGRAPWGGGCDVVLSSRSNSALIAYGCAVEFERVILDSTPSLYFCPYINDAEMADVKVRLESLRSIERLFIVSLNFKDVHRILARAPDVVEKAQRIFIYVFDALLDTKKLKWPDAAIRQIPHYRSLSKLKEAKLFIPVHGMVERFAEILRMDTQFLPIGVDTQRIVGEDLDRPIDVNAYGRQPADMITALKNSLPTESFLFWTGHTGIGRCADLEGQRRVFWHLLSRSKLALAYDPTSYDAGGRINSPFIGQRWFESLAAGCVVVGRAPRCAETSEFFDWPYSVIDLRGDWTAQAHIVREMLFDEAFLAEVRRKNLENIKRHDWRARIAVMLGDPATAPGPSRDRP